jgi:hypothetical protein
MRAGAVGRVLRGCAALAILGLTCPLAASAGTPGQTESLGASKGLEYMRAKHADVVTQTVQPANCDGDAQIVGGGGAMAGPAGASTLNETYPAAPSAWHAEGNTSSGARTLTAYAVCGGFIPQYENNQSALPENATLVASASCDSGLDPIAGGGGATGPGILTIASYPRLPPSSPLGWSPVARNTTIDDTLWDAYAVCSDLDVSHRESERVRVATEEAGKAIAPCKRREAVVSGGWAAKREDVVGFTAKALTSRPWDSKDDGNDVPDDGWLVKALNLHTERIDLVANATCKRPAR